MSECRSYLITGDETAHFEVWAATAAFVNWIEGRHGRNGVTWMVVCFDDGRERLLKTARRASVPVTIEEITHTLVGCAETYDLLVGEPGTGWVPGGPIGGSPATMDNPAQD